MGELVPISMIDVLDLCKRYHGYGSAGKVGTYAFGVIEGGQLVAAYSWQPPPPGCAKSVCPENPSGVLSLSRMVALPKDQRALKHVSKPLKVQMKCLINRERWPVLVTFSDESLGHTGYVYQCSGWEKTTRKRALIVTNASGARISRYSNGLTGSRDFQTLGYAYIQRWEHWICDRGQALTHMVNAGWKRVPSNRTWKSGNLAFTWVQ